VVEREDALEAEGERGHDDEGHHVVAKVGRALARRVVLEEEVHPNAEALPRRGVLLPLDVDLVVLEQVGHDPLGLVQRVVAKEDAPVGHHAERGRRAHLAAQVLHEAAHATAAPRGRHGGSLPAERGVVVVVVV